MLCVGRPKIGGGLVYRSDEAQCDSEKTLAKLIVHEYLRKKIYVPDLALSSGVFLVM